MLDFVAKKFRSYVNFSLMLTVIVLAIFGAAIGYGAGGESLGYGFLGLIIGVIIGLDIAILFGGMIANFLTLVDNSDKLEAMEEKLDDIESALVKIAKKVNSLDGKVGEVGVHNTTPNNTSSASQTATSDGKAEQSNPENSGTSWWCKECGAKNSGTSKKCTSCNA